MEISFFYQWILIICGNIIWKYMETYGNIWTDFVQKHQEGTQLINLDFWI